MKKFFTILTLLVGLVLITQQQAHAQFPITKGTIMAGGEASLNIGSGNTFFNMGPRLGYFFAKNLAVGANVNFRVGNGNTSLELLPFARLYIKNVFAEVGTGFAVGDGAKGLLIQSSVGYAHFFNENVSVEPKVVLDFATGGTKFQFGLRAGLQVYFRKSE